MSLFTKGKTSKNSKHAHLFGYDSSAPDPLSSSSLDDITDPLSPSEISPSPTTPAAPTPAPKTNSALPSTPTSPPSTSPTGSVKSASTAPKNPVTTLAELTSGSDGGGSTSLFDRKNSSPAVSTGIFTASAAQPSPIDDFYNGRRADAARSDKANTNSKNFNSPPFEDAYTKAITPSENYQPKPNARPQKKSSTPMLRSSASSVSSLVFERDIEHIAPVEHISQQEAVDIGIPSVLDDAAEAFANDDIEIALPGGVSLSSSPSFSPPSEDQNPWAVQNVLTDDLSSLKIASLPEAASPPSPQIPSSPPASPQPRNLLNMAPNAALKRRSIRVDLSQPNSPIITATGLRTPPSDLQAQFFAPQQPPDVDPYANIEAEEEPRWGGTHSRTISETLGNAGTIREIRGLSGVFENPWK